MPMPGQISTRRMNPSLIGHESLVAAQRCREKDRLQEELDQALVEREQLVHKKVELQAEELKKLKELTSGDKSKQFEALTMQCFEKDSELAALRARLEDTHEEDEDGGDDDGTAAATADAAKEALQKMTQLQTELANKDLQLAELNEALANAKQELQVSQESLSLGQPEPQQAMEQLSAELQASKAALEQASLENADLQAQLESMRQTISRLESKKRKAADPDQDENASPIIRKRIKAMRG